MTTILFPTDFSECAIEAQEVAFTLAKLFNAELKIVHVISDTIFKWESEEHFAEAINVFPLQANFPKVISESDAKNKFLETLKVIKAEAEGRGIKASTELLFGNPVQAVLEEEKKIDANMIVMGTHGASGFKEAFIGSVTHGIAKRATCPVLSLREVPEGGFKVDNLVYASNFKEERENDNLAFLKVFAGYFDANITLLYINTPHYFEETNESLTRMRQVAEKHKLTRFKTVVYNHYTVEDGVLTYAHKHDTDIIAVSNHHYGFLKSIVEFRTAEVLVNHAKVPVLTMNIEEG